MSFADKNASDGYVEESNIKESEEEQDETDNNKPWAWSSDEVLKEAAKLDASPGIVLWENGNNFFFV